MRQSWSEVSSECGYVVQECTEIHEPRCSIADARKVQNRKGLKRTKVGVGLHSPDGEGPDEVGDSIMGVHQGRRLKLAGGVMSGWLGSKEEIGRLNQFTSALLMRGRGAVSDGGFAVSLRGCWLACACRALVDTMSYGGVS